MSAQTELTDALMSTMKILQTNKDFREVIRGLDFSLDGTALLAHDSEKLIIYDTTTAKSSKTLFMKNKKISFVKFSQHSSTVIIATDTAPYEVFLWSLYSNELIKQFQIAAEYKVTNLQRNSRNDLFLVSQEDFSLRIFDLNSEHQGPVSQLSFQNQVLSFYPTFDNTGLILAIGCSYQKDGQTLTKIELHSIQETGSKGKFQNIFLQETGSIQNIVFQQDKMCVLLNQKVVLICNSFSGQQNQRISLDSFNEINPQSLTLTPDGKFLLAGLFNGKVLVFDTDNGERISKYEGHSQMCQQIAFSPSHVFFVTGSDSLIFWGPQIYHLNQQA